MGSSASGRARSASDQFRGRAEATGLSQQITETAARERHDGRSRAQDRNVEQAMPVDEVYDHQRGAVRERRVDGNGKPPDYAALIGEYHGMVMAAAARLGIPEADWEDSAQEVELRFWKKDGLAAYDPDMLHQPPAAGWRDGDAKRPGARTAKFGGMYRRFVGLHMMQEMDRHNNRLNRVKPVEGGELPHRSAPDHASAVEQEMDARSWVRKAEAALAQKGLEALVPVLRACVSTEGQMIRRGELGAMLGVSERAASLKVRKMREALKAVGMGPETLAG